jgi:glycosyltransferase involved in cell wall biosynthesis
MRHGATLRWLRLSRELVARGHNVCLSVNQDEAADEESKRVLLDECRGEGWLSSWMETRYRFSRRRGRAAHLLAHPVLTNRTLRAQQDQTCAHVEETVARGPFDAVIISQRKLLFLTTRLRGKVPVIVDWMDSLILHEWRQAWQHYRSGAWRRLLTSAKRLAQAVVQERYYGQRSSANLVVSPVDLRVLNYATGRPDLGRMLFNGVDAFEQPRRANRNPSRLVFSGAMDVPHNYEAAIWFIDHVLPRIVASLSDVHLAVVGRDPIPELCRRAGAHVTVTGAVPDIAVEIAKSALYVAPLVSGGGFRNKVAEALASGTFLAGTSMAVEFLPASLREMLLVGDTPEEFAECVLSFLRNPEEFEDRLRSLRTVLTEEFTWPRRAKEFERIVDDAIRTPASVRIAGDRG